MFLTSHLHSPFFCFLVKEKKVFVATIESVVLDGSEKKIGQGKLKQNKQQQVSVFDLLFLIEITFSSVSEQKQRNRDEDDDDDYAPSSSKQKKIKKIKPEEVVFTMRIVTEEAIEYAHNALLQAANLILCSKRIVVFTGFFFFCLLKTSSTEF